MREDIERVSEFEDLVGWLWTIGNLKRFIPLEYRGYLNLLGLHIQLRKAGGIERLQAGGEFKCYFDAVNRTPGKLAAYVGEGMAKHWQKKRLDKATWDLHFAHLVEPTFDIALYVSDHTGKFDEQVLNTLTSVVDHFKATGEWHGLPSGRTCVTCGQDVTIGQWRRESCPHCGNKLQ